MSKINKIRINNEVYDIQDNSSGYVKGTEINYLVNQMVDEKIAEFLKAGFNTETVDKLPTENISYKTIYLVPSQKPEEENIYNEYIYTSKDKWEMIGSTKTDLSDYYTKEEVDDAIANVAVDGTTIIRFCFNSTNNSDTITDEENLTKASKMINDWKNGIRPLCNYYKKNLAWTKYHLSDIVARSFNSVSFPENGTATYYFLQTTGVIGNYNAYFMINGTWTDGVFTCTNIYFKELRDPSETAFNMVESSLALSINNSITYTPKGDYNPATKKYVDDSISGIDIPTTGDFYIITNDNKSSEETLNAVNEAYQKFLNDEPYELYGKVDYSNSYLGGHLVQRLMFSSLSTTVYLLGVPHINSSTNQSGTLSIKTIRVTMTFEDGVITKINTISKDELEYGFGDLVTTENSSTWYPNKDYGGVHKLYVDNIAKNLAIYDFENNSISLYKGLVNYNVGDKVYYWYDNKFYECITAHYSQSYITKSNWREFTEEELEAIKRPTKAYVDDAVANAGGGELVEMFVSSASLKDATIYAQEKEKWTAIIQALLEDRQEDVYNKYYATYQDNGTEFMLLNGVPSNYDLKNKYETTETIDLEFSFSRMVPIENFARFKMQYWSMDIRIKNKEITQIKADYTGTNTYIKEYSGSTTYNTVIGTKNQFSYTPTADYHPATKKYVDDSISTALGDVNSILATLTTVEEGE